MAKKMMTAAEKEAAETEVKETVEDMAKDVAEKVSDERPKKKTKPKHSTVARTPAREKAASDDVKRGGLKGVIVDPDENYPKLLHLIVSVGKDDTRDMDEFVSQVRETLTDECSAKNVAVLMQQYAIEGQHILSHHYDEAVAKLRSEEPDTDE